MLLDDFLPLYQFNEKHSIVIKTKSSSSILFVIKDITPAEIPLFFELIWLRSIPSRVFSSEKNEIEIVRKKPLVEQFLKSGFILLAEHENQELVIGRIAQFWKLIINDSIPRIHNTQEFLAFNNPSYAKVAMNFYVDHNHVDDEIVRLSTETRIDVPDQIARKKFARYWFVIHSFSAFSRKMLLRAVKRRLETQ